MGGLIPHLRGFYFEKDPEPKHRAVHELDKKHPALQRKGKKRNTWSCKSPTLCCMHGEQLLCKNSFFNVGILSQHLFALANHHPNNSHSVSSSRSAFFEATVHPECEISPIFSPLTLVLAEL